MYTTGVLKKQSDKEITEAERATLQAIGERLNSMIKATQDLQELGQDIRAAASWRAKVLASASVVTGGATTIQATTLPSFLSPFVKNLAEMTNACSAIAASFREASTTITPQTIATQQESLASCERNLKRLTLSVESIE